MVEYGLRLEHDYLLVFTTNLDLIGHIVTIKVTQYSQKEPDYWILREIKIEYKDGRCRLTQDRIDFTSSRVTELRTSLAGSPVTQSIADMFYFAPYALQTQDYSFLCGEIQYEWHDPSN